MHTLQQVSISSGVAPFTGLMGIPIVGGLCAIAQDGKLETLQIGDPDTACWGVYMVGGIVHNTELSKCSSMRIP